VTYVEFNVVKDELRFFIQDDCFLFFEKDTDWKNYKFEPNNTTAMQVVKKFLVAHHHGHVELALRRKFITTVRKGNINVHGQDVVVIDVDRADRTTVQATVDFILETFGKAKFIEYAPDRDRYHVYIQFDEFVTDEDCRAIQEYLASCGHLVEVKQSRQHFRFPMGNRYRVFGFYSRSSPVRVRKASIKRLAQYWEHGAFVVPFPAEIT
jgi:hypothetical protein